ncbi:MAG: biopolymer transporter ExbD [Cyclobacteriaceae bacterium]
MPLQSKHKVEAAFSMSGMTDVIFLLLIFFMLTSSFITPSGLPVNLPTSRNSTIIMQKVTVTITADLDYLVNDRRVSINALEAELRQELQGDEGVVVLHVDKSVPTEHLVNVASIAAGLKAKVSLATKPN